MQELACVVDVELATGPVTGGDGVFVAETFTLLGELRLTPLAKPLPLAVVWPFESPRAAGCRDDLVDAAMLTDPLTQLIPAPRAEET